MSRARLLVRDLIPPVLYRLASRLMRGGSDRVWEGIYARFADVPAGGPAFASTAWMNGLAGQLDQILTARAELGRVPREIFDVEVLASISSGFPGSVKVLDFGGGIGAAYASLRSAIEPSFRLEMTVVEQPAVAELGRERWSDDINIRFVTNLPPADERFDIVHVRTALQYVEDYEATLRRLATYRPKHILLMHASAGEQPSFVTAQVNDGESRIPYWFLQADEVVAILEKEGYRLGSTTLLSKETRQSNFPPSHRIGRLRNIVFHRAR